MRSGAASESQAGDMLITRTQFGIDRSFITIEQIQRPWEFGRMQSEWNELLENSGVDCLFLTWEWLYTWWKHMAENRELSIFAARCGHELIAIAPVAKHPPNLDRGRPFSTLEFLGTGQVGSDYLDFIVRRGYETQAIDAFAGVLAAKRLVLDWTQLKQPGCMAARIAQCLAGKGWAVSEARTNVCPFIPLDGHTWESYLATLGSEHRYSFKRKWKRLQQDFTVRTEEVTTEEACLNAVSLVIKLHNLRWQDRGGSDAFCSDALAKFHREWAELARKRGWLRLFVLYLNEKPAACLYGFCYRQTFYFYQSGFDPAFASYGVGLVTMGLAIKKAIEEGDREYDLLHGNELYKSHWSRNSRDIGRLELYPPGGVGRIWRLSVELGRASRRTVKRFTSRADS
jgi:CelD/BcsL family acetyltransferase involved in cellulose biosynthesis